MRIELNSGGLSGTISIAKFQTDLDSLINRSQNVISAFKSVKKSIYNMNGGVGNLQSAVDNIEKRIKNEEQVQQNLNDTKKQISDFIKKTEATDGRVGELIDQNKEEFYRINPWAKPAVSGPNALSVLGDIWNWLCDAFAPLIDTVHKVIDGIRDWWEDIHTITPIEIASDVYDKDHPGYYGGDQMYFETADAAARRRMMEIYNRNNPNDPMTDAEFRDYLKKLTSEGCAYVAMVNTIFEYYRGRPEDFEKAFGYPMYDENGHFNYELLTMDIYSRMDNRDEHGNIIYGLDPSNTEGWGSTLTQNEYYLEQFMKEHGVDVDFKPNVKLTPETCDSILASGKQIIVGFHYGNLYYMDGTKKCYIDGGHAMTVTGVTEDGKLIVSSWGKQYYIDPSENGLDGQWIDYAIVDYK